MFAARDPRDVDRFFRGLAEHAFHGRLGVVDPPLVEYVSGLLVRFLRGDGLQPPPDVTTTVRHAALGDAASREMPGEPVRWMIAVVSGATPDRGVEDFRWIGDTTLFWTGLYPEALPRIAPVDFRSLGRRAYWIASTLGPEPAVERGIYARLSHEFDVCVAGLAEVRRAWGE